MEFIEQKENEKEEINTSSNQNIIKNLPNDNEDDTKYINELFKRIKVNAKIVEYNEFGLPKDTDPEILQYVTNKEFQEGVDIFIPAPKDNLKDMRRFDTDIKEENMNEEYKELDAEMTSSDDEYYNNNNKENKNEKKEKEIIDNNNNEKENENEKEKEIKIIEEGNIEDNFILIANNGELPIEFLSEKELQEKEELENKNNPENKNQHSYKFITKEEEEYILRKLEEDDKKKHKKKVTFVTKSEFNDAINELLNTKKGKELNKNNTINGLKKSYEDEGEYEEYELDDDENIPEEIKREIEKVEKLEKENMKNKMKLNNNKLENKEEEYEEIEEKNEKNEKDKLIEDLKLFKPNIKIEYVTDKPDPFDKKKKNNQNKEDKKNNKIYTKSKTKQYEIDKKNGNLSDESFTKEELEEMTLDKEFVEKTVEMFNNKENEEYDEKIINEDIEKNYIHEPHSQIRKNINQIEGKINYLPKEIKEVRKEKIKKNKINNNEKNDNKNDINIINNNNNKEKNEDIKGDFNGIDDEKKKNKLRKQALKAERREKRKEKKELKQAFKNEKKLQQHQIAETNKTIRYGLSIKDL